MRIALFHNAPSGGAKRAIFEWTRRLSAHNDIYVYTLSTADHDFCDIRPLVRKHQVFYFSEHKLFQSPLGRLNQLQRWRDLNELTKVGHTIATTIDEDAYDVVFAHTCRFTFIPPMLRYLNTPSVFYLHEPFGSTFVREIRRPYAKPNQVRRLLNRLDPLISLYFSGLSQSQSESVGSTGLLVANSRFTQHEINKAFGIDTLVCPYGVDLDAFHPLPNVARADFVLSVGEMSPRKGFDFLVECLALIPERGRPPLKLACNRVEVSELNYVQHLAEIRGVNLEVLTNVDTEAMNLLYNQARLCLYAPILEPFGLVPLEAMACGTAVIGVREGGVQESILHMKTGMLVERDPASFADAIQSLLDNATLADEFGRNGRAHVLSNWTWDRSVGKIEEFLHSVSSTSGLTRGSESNRHMYTSNLAEESSPNA